MSLQNRAARLRWRRQASRDHGVGFLGGEGVKNLQSLGVMLLVLFLGAAWYFHDSIPTFSFGPATVLVARPPLWSLAGSFGGGLVLLIIGSIGVALEKSRKSDRADS